MNELPDNEGLEPILAGNCILGLNPEINGSDAVACPEYVPTRHELLQLARHWYGTLLGIQVDWFFTHQSGSYEYRILLYAERRLDRIIEAIGREAVEKVATEVDAGYRERMAADWDAFIRGGNDDGAVESLAEILREQMQDPKSIPHACRKVSQMSEEIAVREAAPSAKSPVIDGQNPNISDPFPSHDVAAGDEIGGANEFTQSLLDGLGSESLDREQKDEDGHAVK